MSGDDSNTIIERLEKALLQEFSQTEDKISVAGDGHSVLIRVYSQDLLNISKVKQQQKVYASINSFIKNGEIHAVTIQVLKTWID